MKFILLIVLFIICEVFIAFSNAPEQEKALNASKGLELKKFFTGYNPDLEKKGIMKSSFKHEMNPIYK